MVRALLDDIGAEFVSVVVVTQDMISKDLPLGVALATAQDQKTGRDWKPASGPDVPRLMLLSGMSSEEIMSVIQEYNELGAGGCGVGSRTFPSPQPAVDRRSVCVRFVAGRTREARR